MMHATVEIPEETHVIVEIPEETKAATKGRRTRRRPTGKKKRRTWRELHNANLGKIKELAPGDDDVISKVKDFTHDVMSIIRARIAEAVASYVIGTLASYCHFSIAAICKMAYVFILHCLYNVYTDNGYNLVDSDERSYTEWIQEAVRWNTTNRLTASTKSE